MSAPSYEWMCQNCGKPNPAHTGTCATCGFAAYFKTKDLFALREEDVSEPEPKAESELGQTLWMFFPEAIPAFILALYAPFWAIRMFANGEVLPAVCLIAGELASGYGFIQGWRFSKKWISYGSMLAFLLLGYFVHSVVK